MPFSSQVEIEIEYKGEILRKKFRADFVVDSTVILELKSAKSLTPEDQSQLLNYLSATEFQLGLLLNFGSPKLGIKRMIL